MKMFLAAAILTLSVLGTVSTASADPINAYPAWAQEVFESNN